MDEILNATKESKDREESKIYDLVSEDDDRLTAESLQDVLTDQDNATESIKKADKQVRKFQFLKFNKYRN